MREVYVYIDDSGSPGQAPANKFQAQDSKLWAAVILSQEEKNYIESKIEFIRNELQNEIKFSEFHFTEIYSGKKNFKNIDSNIRLKIFADFVELYNKIKPYVIVTSVGIGTLKNSGFSEAYINTKENGFDFNNPGDYALYMLLIIINEYFAENYKEGGINTKVIIDEGRKKENTIQPLNELLGVCKQMVYKSSADECGLQFIDFIAFSINRIQNNFSKKRSLFDDEFMRIIGKLQLNSNLPKIEISNLEELNKDLVESFMEKQKKMCPEMAGYIEELSRGIAKYKRACLNDEPIKIEKEEILEDIENLKQKYFYNMSDEFLAFIDIVLQSLQI